VVLLLLLVLGCDLLLPSDVLICDVDVVCGTTIFGERMPSADCHAIVNGLLLYIAPSDTA